MANALLLALTKGKGKGPMSPPEGDDGGSEPSPDAGASKDYKQLAKDAAKDGDWDAMVDALCGYVDAEEASESPGED